MENCKKLDFRSRDVSTKILNSFNLVSDEFSPGFFFISVFSCSEEASNESISMSLDELYTHMCLHISMAGRRHLFVQVWPT